MSAPHSKRPTGSLLLTLLLVVFTAITFLTHPVSRWFETDLLSLFASEASGIDPVVMKTLRETVTNENRRATVFLLGAAEDTTDPERVRRAVRRAAERLEESGLFTPTASPVLRATDALHEKAPILLTPERTEWLAKLPRDEEGNWTSEACETLLQQLQTSIVNPVAPHWLGLDRDPFSFADETLYKAIESLPVREEAGLLRLTGNGTLYLLRYDADAFSAESGEGRLSDAVESLRVAFSKRLTMDGLTPVFHATGVPLFTDAIARKAHIEMNRIALFSSVLVFGVAWWLFGRFLSVLGALLTVSFGFAVGFAVALSVFGTLHLLTFVFGLTLIGVAVDYSVHWFMAGRTASVPELLARRDRMRPSLVMAALSSAAGYAILAATPMTGLQEIAVLAGVGLPATLFFVLVLLPRFPILLPRKESRALQKLLSILARLPRFSDASRGLRVFIVALVLFFIATGLSNLRFSGGASDLQDTPMQLVTDRQAIDKRLALPSPAQFYLVSGPNLNDVLLREQRLSTTLRTTLPHLTVTALSDLVPDMGTQKERYDRSREAFDLVAPVMTEWFGAATKTSDFQALTPDDWIQAGLAERIHPNPLLQSTDRTVTAVFLSGVTLEDLPKLTALATDEVTFVNLTATMEDEMTRYRTRIFEGLLLGFAILTLCLSFRMGRHTWRAVLPPVLGILSALAVSGFANVPVTLFTALALVLLLGLGIDYGIFLYHQPDQPRAFAAVLLSALTSLASFGLLAFSSTPALFSFGATVGTGLFVILVTAPLLRRRDDVVRPGTPRPLPAQGGTSC